MGSNWFAYMTEQGEVQDSLHPELVGRVCPTSSSLRERGLNPAFSVRFVPDPDHDRDKGEPISTGEAYVVSHSATDRLHHIDEDCDRADGSVQSHWMRAAWPPHP